MGFTMRGHAEIDSAFRKIEMYSATLHCVHNQVTRIDGDRAEGEFYCVANHIHERDGVEYKLDMESATRIVMCAPHRDGASRTACSI